MSDVEPGISGDSEPLEPIGVEIGFDDFQANPEEGLKPGNVITELDGYRNLDLFERIVANLVSYRTAPYGTIRAEDRGRYLSSPLSGHLKPKNFFGNLENGVALVGSVTDYRCGVVVATDLTSSSRSSKVGTVIREVTYSEGTQASTFGPIRKFGRAPSLKQAERIAEELNLASAERALSVTRYALRHLYRGGLPQ